MNLLAPITAGLLGLVAVDPIRQRRGDRQRLALADAEPLHQRGELRDAGWPREQRLAAATYVIDNTGTLEDLRRRVEEVVAALTA